MYGMGDLNYSDFVNLYLNKINPNTNMYWTLADVSVKTGVPLDTLQIMLTQAQQVNYTAVSSGSEPLSAPQIIAAGAPPALTQQTPTANIAPTAPIPAPSQVPATGSPDGFTYYNPEGFGYRQGVDKLSYWEEKNGTWSEGDLNGNVKINVQWPPWFNAVDIQRAVNKIIAIKGSEGPGGLPPATKPSGLDFGTLIGAALVGYGLLKGNMISLASGALTLLKK